MGRHAERRDPITDPVNIEQLLDPKGVKHVSLPQPVQESDVESLGVVTESNGLPVVRPPRPRRSPKVGTGSEDSGSEGEDHAKPSKAERVERAFAIHRILRAAAFAILCAFSGAAWTGLLTSAWSLVSDIWWLWLFVVGSALGFGIFTYDLGLAIRYRKYGRDFWKGHE